MRYRPLELKPNVAGPRCTVCESPNRYEIDQALAADSDSVRNIAKRYGVHYSAVHRHKGHVNATALRAAEVRDLSLLEIVGDGFTEAVKRLRLLLDANHEWLTDPEDPDRYTLEPRANEVTVVYLERNAAGQEVRKRGDLQTLLDSIAEHKRVRPLYVETNRADPRLALLKAVDSFDRKLVTLLQASAEQREREQAKALAAQAGDTEAELRDLIAATLPEDVLAAGIEEALTGPLGEQVAGKVAEVLAPVLGPWIVARFTETEGES